MNITEANKILTAVREGTAKQDGYTAQQIKDAKARMAQFNKTTGNDRTTGLRKAEMAYGGAVKGKKHNYAAGGMVKDNAGLRALKKSSPEAYKKITGK